MTTHTGGCHCGAVRYEVDMDVTSGMECNCSICSKRGWLLAFAPITSFRLTKGEDMLTEYLFNKHVVHHLFCKVCGTESFARGVAPDGNEVAAINLRCLDGVDLSNITINKFDGKSA